jgi:PAS domain S-box-containing protein/putative nucleotidyltransferase with HDIG domain
MPKKSTSKTQKQLVAENEDLRARLDEAEETLRAIRSGELGALIVSGVDGEQILTLKQAEDALQKEKDRGQQYLDIAGVMFLVLSTDRKVILINKKGCEILGYDEREIVDRSWFDFIPQAEKDRTGDVFDKVMAGEIERMEYFENPVLTKRGQERLVAWHNSVLTDESGRIIGIVSSGTDITERKRAEESLRESEEKHRTLFERMAQGVVYQAADGRITSANPAAERILGLTLDQMQGRTSTDSRWKAIHEDGSDFPGDTHPAMVALATAKEVYNVVMGVFNPEKEDYKWINVIAIPQVRPGETVPYKVFSTLEDFTERKRADEELRNREGFLQRIFDILPVGLWFADKDGKLLRGNPAGVKIWGAEPKVSLPDSGVFKARRLPSGVAVAPDDWALAHTIRDGVTIVDELLEIDAFDGRKKTILNYTAPVLDAQGVVQGAIVVNQDITERKQAEDKIRRQLEHLSAKSAIDRVVASVFDLKLCLSEILSHVTTELGVDAADILTLIQGSRSLEYCAERGFRSNPIRKARVRLGETYAGRAVLERQIVKIPDLRDDPNNLFLTNLLTGEGFVSYYGVPLIAKGQIKGVMEVFNRTAIEPDSEWLDFLNSLAGQTAIAIENSTLFENLQRSNSELNMAYDATIEGWSHALDLRDKETEGHTLRVAEMTVEIALTIGLDEDELVQVRRGALLHDIGKMGVPDGILLKPGPLTAEEWVVMKKHPTYAYEMLLPIRYLHPALNIPYCHHEKWDGTGYPRGLKGEQIPLAARIFAVVDVWDALTSDRPYRLAWTKEKTRQHILDSSGTHFDPQVVDLYMRSIV